MTSSGFTLSGLSYLATSYLWWWIAALIVGIIIGFSTFDRDKKSSGLFPWLLLIGAGSAVAYLKIVPDRLGLWFDTAVLMASSYFVGCILGCLIKQLFSSAETKPVVVQATKLAPKAVVATIAALPEIMPYQWQAQKDGNTITLAGFAPSIDAKNRIVASAKAVFAGATINDRLQLGAGAPSSFETVSDSAFNHLSKLDKGIAALIDSSYTLTGAAGSLDAKSTVDALANSLPTGFKLARTSITVSDAALKNAPAITDKPAGLLEPRNGNADDLKRIRGIGRQNETRLHGLGIWHFDQIAAWSAEEVLWVGHFLAFPGRIERESWVTQAKTLDKTPATVVDTDFSKQGNEKEVLPSAGIDTNSSNLKTDDYEGKRPTSLNIARNSRPDNLKLVNGVNEEIEKKLNDAGIWHFDQIAQMSNDELTWVSAYSGFPNKAMQENWKGESAILAVGGETDHSKAVKSGKTA